MIFSPISRDKNAVTGVEILFILLLLIFGLPMVVVIPPGTGYDEEDHLVRVWEMSAFSFIPGQMPPQELKYPTIFRDFAYRQQGSSGTLGKSFWQKYAQASLSDRGFVHRELETKSVYSPMLLLPQAIAMRVGRSTDLPALFVLYLCRFASLISYLVLVWLAIRWIPFGKWILLVLALVPMAVFQATTITPDAISNGIGFLFIAGCLRIAGNQEIGWKETIILIALVFLLFLAKLNLIPLVLLPFLLIPPSRFPQKRNYIFLLAVTVILFALEVAGWNWIAATRANPLLANDANPKAQLLYSLSHPFGFLFTLGKDLITNGWTYFQSWINGYGYYYWTPPLIVSLFFLLSLGAVLWIDSTREHIGKKQRTVYLLVFLAGYLVTAVSLYVTFTPVGADKILGVQGRYFIPLALLLFLVLSSLPWRRKFAAPSSRWIAGFLAIALSLNLAGIGLSFYVPCGSTVYQIGLCYRPLSRDFTNTRLSPTISNGVSLTQEIHVQCDGLTEVRVLLSPAMPGDKGTTHFRLKNPANSQILFDTSIANRQIAAEDWYPLRFPPDWQSAGKQYVLEILGTDMPDARGLQVLYTTQSEFDLGDLRQNGQLLSENIVLQYGCATGLQKLWLTGKP